MGRRTSQHKTVLITGAGRGLGAALCLRFGEEGSFIIACDIHQKNLYELSNQLNEKNIPHLIFICDISKEAEVKEMFNKIKKEGKKIDILINNAGVTHIKLFKDNANSDIRKLMEINFLGAVYTTRGSYNDIIKNKGSIIAISSVAGFAPLMGRTAYAASKHAIFGFFETLRTEVADEGVDVLIACPGFINTKLREHTYNKGENNENTKVSTGKNASPEEVADLIYKAWQKRKRIIVTGLGVPSFFIKRFFPKWYDRLMIKKMKKAFGK